MQKYLKHHLIFQALSEFSGGSVRVGTAKEVRSACHHTNIKKSTKHVKNANIPKTRSEIKQARQI